MRHHHPYNSASTMHTSDRLLPPQMSHQPSKTSSYQPYLGLDQQQDRLRTKPTQDGSFSRNSTSHNHNHNNFNCFTCSKTAESSESATIAGHGAKAASEIDISQEVAISVNPKGIVTRSVTTVPEMELEALAMRSDQDDSYATLLGTVKMILPMIPDTDDANAIVDHLITLAEVNNSWIPEDSELHSIKRK
eukprot:TRINITY_DN67805_c10_g2_i2.p1 TRINITY_DN67805_c10_g2~~TRINITY_DN67805_c10_g2_i2.p1  ORF type:complete len:191 (-),score=5.78 TRINITY_DN67805_c10_g2_i2:156-728(-)